MGFDIEDNVLKKYHEEPGITAVSVPDGVTVIDRMAFYNCDTLRLIYIPDTVTEIGNLAFACCRRLAGILIPESVTTIGDSAFSVCTSLTCVEIPAPVTQIGTNPFIYCTNLTHIAVDKYNKHYDSRNNCNAIIETATDTLVAACITTVVPATVTEIGVHAFAGCTGLTEIELPEAVTEIDSFAFEGCINLKELTVNGFADIDINCIRCLNKLEAIYLTNTCTANAEIVLKTPLINGLRKHPELYPPRSVIEFLPMIFRDDDIETMHILADAGRIDPTDFVTDYLEPAQQAGAFECIAYLLNWKHENIADRDDDSEILLNGRLDSDPFNEHDMAKLWRYSVKYDGTVRLNRYKGDEETVTVPGRIGSRTVTSIGNRAFAFNETVTEITVPASVTEIGKSAFVGCKKLASFTIPPSVTQIAFGTFAQCFNLRSVVIPPTVTEIGSKAFELCRNLTAITIPDAVTEIGSLAFDECEKLESIALPAGVKEIKDGTFRHCHKLKELTMKYVEKIGDRVFEQCHSITTLTFPDTLTTIGRFVLNQFQNLAELNIPASVTAIGRQGYLSAKKLNKISVHKDNPVYNSGNGCNAIIETATDTLIFACDSTVIPDTVKVIGIDAFSFCSKITEIIIPPSVTTIEYGAFEYCENLRNVIIPSSVTSIDGHLFTGCRQLKEVFIPDSVTDIGEFLFGIYNETGKILCHKNSPAEKYAAENGIEYEVV